MELLEDSTMPSNTLPEAVQESSPSACACVGPCAGYGSHTVCPSLLVVATLVAAKNELAATSPDAVAG